MLVVVVMGVVVVVVVAVVVVLFVEVVGLPNGLPKFANGSEDLEEFCSNASFLF